MTGILRGSCYCKAVRVECALPSRFVAHCHCENCRRAHGSGFVTWVGIPDPQFRIVAGEASIARYVTDTAATRSFCRECGTMMLYSSPRWPGEVHVAAAVIDDPLDRMPTAHVYADRSPAWCPITDDLPRRGGASGVEPL